MRDGMYFLSASTVSLFDGSFAFHVADIFSATFVWSYLVRDESLWKFEYFEQLYLCNGGVWLNWRYSVYYLGMPFKMSQRHLHLSNVAKYPNTIQKLHFFRFCLRMSCQDLKEGKKRIFQTTYFEFFFTFDLFVKNV